MAENFSQPPSTVISPARRIPQQIEIFEPQFHKRDVTNLSGNFVSLRLQLTREAIMAFESLNALFRAREQHLLALDAELKTREMYARSSESAMGHCQALDKINGELEFQKHYETTVSKCLTMK